MQIDDERPWLRAALSRIDERAASLDALHGGGGSWYRSIARAILRRSADGRWDREQYRTGVRTAADLIIDGLSPSSDVTDVGADEFLVQYAGTEPASSTAIEVVRTILDSEVETVLPPGHESIGTIVNGIHVPVRFSGIEPHRFFEDPIVILTNSARARTPPAPAGNDPVLSVDVPTNRVAVATSAKAGFTTIGHLDWAATPTTWHTTLRADDRYSTFDVAELTSDGVHLFGHNVGRAHDVTGYRIGAGLDESDAEAITNGFRRYDAIRRGGAVGDGELDAATNIDINDYGFAMPDLRAGIGDTLRAVRGSAEGGEIPAAAVTAGLKFLPDDPFVDTGERWRSAATHEMPDIERRILLAETRGTLPDEIIVLARVDVESVESGRAAQSDPFDVDLTMPVDIEAVGDGLVTEDRHSSVLLQRGQPSGLTAFRFRAVPGAQRQIVYVRVRQSTSGVVLGQVPLQGFHEQQQGSAALKSSSALADVQIRVDNCGGIHVYAKDFKHGGGPRSSPLPSDDTERPKLDSFVKSVESIAKGESEREDTTDVLLTEYAYGLRNALPWELVDYLDQRGGGTLLIEHPPDRTFPFELVLLETRPTRTLLGETYVITRWSNVAPVTPSADTLPVTRAAFISDRDTFDNDGAERDAHVTALQRCCATESFYSVRELRTSVLQSTDYGLLDFVTHMEMDGEQLGLKIGKSVLRPGSLHSGNNAFATTAALVFVNACNSSRPDAGLYGSMSFPQQFLNLRVPAVITTTLPVEGPLALRFGSHFYERVCAGLSLGRALYEARRALRADESVSADEGFRRLAAASYCLFGSPDMTIDFRSPIESEEQDVA